MMMNLWVSLNLHTRSELRPGSGRVNILYFLQVKIWDTAGSEKYMSISAVYYRKADGVIFVFDVTKPKSFTDIETVWMQAVEAPEQ